MAGNVLNAQRLKRVGVVRTGSLDELLDLRVLIELSSGASFDLASRAEGIHSRAAEGQQRDGG